MQAFEISHLAAQAEPSDRPYLEFLREPSLSLGLYRLPAGSLDPQQPHREDEVYYVLDGRATIRVAGEDRAVGPESIVFVAAGVVHRFHTIVDDLTILVFFAPAESANAQTTA